MSDQNRFLLSEKDIPKAWYNVQPDLPGPLPPVIHPGTKQPIGPDDFAPLFPMQLIMQEVSQDREVEIPEPVREIYRLWRPTPLIRARRLEKALDTPAHIYYKYEGVSPVGSHKPNTAVAQAFYNKQEGAKALATETGAGQWGSALAMACRFFGLACEVKMVKASYEQKPYRRIMMESYGAKVMPSPSDNTQAGRNALAQDPNHPGSLGLAISEAVELVATAGGAKKYSLGSVLNHVLLHQTVIGQEAMKQFELAGEGPDIMIGCIGGGSSFSGFVLPFVGKELKNGSGIRFIAVEPTAAPSLTKGKYIYDFGDAAATLPLVKMYTLGHSFIPAPIHAGGLRYHGMAPIVCYLYDTKVIEAVAVPQNPVFEAAMQFVNTEGIFPAPEPAHAIRVAIDEALKCKESGEKKVIAFNLCGHGHFDMGAYESYAQGKLDNYEYPAAAVEEAMKQVPAL